MRFISASDDMHKAASQLQFQHKDLVQEPSKPKTWRVPKQTLAEVQAFWDLMLLYNQTESPDVVKAAESRGRRIKIKKGPTWYLMGKGYSTGPNELFVGIVGMAPSNLPGTSSGVMMTVEKTGARVSDGEHSQEPDDHSRLQHGVHKVRDDLKTDIDMLVFAASRSQQPATEIEPIITASLGKELEVLIRKNTDVHHSVDLPALRVGDRIELTSLEELEVKSGLLPILAMAYEETGIEDGAGDRGKGY